MQCTIIAFLRRVLAALCTGLHARTQHARRRQDCQSAGLRKQLSITTEVCILAGHTCTFATCSTAEPSRVTCSSAWPMLYSSTGDVGGCVGASLLQLRSMPASMAEVPCGQASKTGRQGCVLLMQYEAPASQDRANTGYARSLRLWGLARQNHSSR